MVFVTASHLGYALVLSGKEVLGHELLEQSVAKTGSGVFQSSRSQRISWLAEADLRMGNLESAKEHAGHALELARGQKERGNIAWTLRLLGEIHSHPEALGVEEAEDHYGQALALASELGMRPLQAHCRKGLGALLGKTSRTDEARAELAAAMDMYREMEMAYWLERAEETLDD
jgi:tetratricopeptide (TPR) repeat protein